MATRAQMVDVAASQVGIKESPAGSNKQKYGVWYGMNGEPWCDMFVSWCAAQAGQTDVGKYAYCPYHVSYFKNAGKWRGRDYTPKAGDIIFFANKGTACHVGIVEYAASDGIHTIEGNTSVTSNDNGGAVMRRTRTLGNTGTTWYVLGYGTPNYTDEVDELALTKEQTDQLCNAIWSWGNHGWQLEQVYDKTDETNKEVTRTDDPTGRGKLGTTHLRVNQIAPVLQETLAAVKENNELLKQLINKL